MTTAPSSMTSGVFSRFVVVVVLLTAASVCSADPKSAMNPCHAGKRNHPAPLCESVVIPEGMCFSCPFGSYGSDGRYDDCTKTTELGHSGCLERIEQYVQLNKDCDPVRRQAFIDYTNETLKETVEGLDQWEMARQVLDFFMYAMCEQTCDCLPQIGAKAEEPVVDIFRGNCQAHAYYDVCAVYPNIKSIRSATLHAPIDDDLANMPKVCPILTDWIKANPDWATLASTCVDPAVQDFLTIMVQAGQLTAIKMWSMCYDLETTQGRIQQVVQGVTENAVHLYINSGVMNKETLINGIEWQRDQYFKDGENQKKSKTFDIQNHQDDELFSSDRFGNAFDYVFEPIPNGEYELTLHFAETWKKMDEIDERVFNVSVEGIKWLEQFDIYKEGTEFTGDVEVGNDVAVVKKLDVSVLDEKLTVSFRRTPPSTEPAKVNAIELHSKSRNVVVETPVCENPDQDPQEQQEELVETWKLMHEATNYQQRHECSFVQIGKYFFLFGGREKPNLVNRYDFAQDKWTKASYAPAALNHFQAVEYQGLMYVIGAFKNNDYPSEIPAERMFLYDPSIDHWFLGREIPQDRRRASGGLVVVNDKFYLVGGNNKGHNGGFVAYLDVYDPLTNEWTALEDAPRARDHFHAVAASGLIYVIGGRTTDLPNPFDKTVEQVDVYDVINAQWTTIDNAKLPHPRAGAATAYLNGKIYIIGGESDKQKEAYKRVDVFNTMTGEFDEKMYLKNGRHGTQAIVSGQGIFVAAGSPRRGGGRMKNMEYLYSKTPVGEESTPGVLEGTNNETMIEILRDGALGTKDLVVSHVSGNTGAVIRHLVITGEEASMFSIQGMDTLDPWVLRVGGSVTITVGYMGHKREASATLEVLYGADQVLAIPLVGYSKKCFTSQFDLHTAVREYFDPVKADGVKFIYGDEIGKWCVDQVTDFSFIFEGLSDFNEPLPLWNTAKATTMKGMFRGATNFEQDLSHFETGLVTDMSEMFLAAKAFTGRGVAGWDVSSLLNAQKMFYSADSFNAALRDWEVSHLLEMQNMFQAAKAFDGYLCPWRSKLSSTATVTSMLSSSGCEEKGDPNLGDSQGPFCTKCDFHPLHLYINAGGPGFRYNGAEIDPDHIYLDPATEGGVFAKEEPIDGTDMDVLYTSERYGELTYNIPVDTTEYGFDFEVTLLFAELEDHVPEERVFDIWMQGEIVEEGLDIHSELGGKDLTALRKTYSVQAPDDNIQIALRAGEYGSPKEPKINGIEVHSALAPIPALDTPEPAFLAQVEGPFDLPLVAAAASLLPNGTVLVWSSRKRYSYDTGFGATMMAIFDPSAPEVMKESLISHTKHDMFCPGTSYLADGRMMVSGGSDSNRTSFFDPATDTWTMGPKMNIGRGYHTQALLNDGSVFTLGGSWSGGEGKKDAELFRPSRNWKLLPGITAKGDIRTEDRDGVYRADNHMWLFQAPNCKIFQAGPSRRMHWINVGGDGSVTPGIFREDDLDAMNGNAVYYDIGKILTVGGAPSYDKGIASNRAYIVDLNGEAETVTRTGNMHHARAFHNSVVLPTGEILVVGGKRRINRLFSDKFAIYEMELWNPTTGEFTLLEEKITIPRVYHGVALLLPDGRVFVSGSGLCGEGCDYNTAVNHPDAEIVTPPYLLQADGSHASQPVISEAPVEFEPGAEMTVKLTQQLGADVSFVLMRYGPVTHAVNTDQRRIPLTILNSAGATYKLQVPGNACVVLPGHYMLYAITGQGVPSKAHFLMRSQAGTLTSDDEDPEEPDPNQWDCLVSGGYCSKDEDCCEHLFCTGAKSKNPHECKSNAANVVGNFCTRDRHCRQGLECDTSTKKCISPADDTCSGDEEVCSEHDHCCEGFFCNRKRKFCRPCQRTGKFCTVDLHCCGEMTCGENRRCKGNCIEPQQTCTADDECCAVDGTEYECKSGKCKPATCALFDKFCEAHDDCCDDLFCGKSTKKCKECVADGSGCHLTEHCCGSSKCLRNGSNKKVCMSCMPLDSDCTTNEECCNDDPANPLTCQEGKCKATADGTCALVEEPCQATPCCVGFFCSKDEECKECKQLEEFCIQDHHCCPGLKCDRPNKQCIIAE